MRGSMWGNEFAETKTCRREETRRGRKRFHFSVTIETRNSSTSVFWFSNKVERENGSVLPEASSPSSCFLWDLDLIYTKPHLVLSLNLITCSISITVYKTVLILIFFFCPGSLLNDIITNQVRLKPETRPQVLNIRGHRSIPKKTFIDQQYHHISHSHACRPHLHFTVSLLKHWQCAARRLSVVSRFLL